MLEKGNTADLICIKWSEGREGKLMGAFAGPSG
jgi:hypothetical protein